MKTPVTHERLQNHLTYSWWKYVLMMVLVIFFWSILFTTTRYRPPEEKKVIVGVYGAANQTALTPTWRTRASCSCPTWRK